MFACSKFHYYIDGQPSVQVFTDHKALEHMLEGKLSDKLYRWVLILLKYSLVGKFIAGEDNAAADALTRLRHKIRLPDDAPFSLAHIETVFDQQELYATSDNHWLNSLRQDDEKSIHNDLYNLFEVCLVQSSTKKLG